MYPDLTIRTKGLILTFVPLLFITAFVATVLEVQKGNKHNEAVSLHSKEVLGQAQIFAQTLDGLESSASACFTDSSAEHLMRFTLNLKEAPRALAQIQDMVKDRPVQVYLVGRIIEDTAKETARLTQIVALAQAKKPTEALSLYAGADMQQKLLSVRTSLRTFIHEQEHLDADSQADLALSWEILYWWLLGGVGGHILLTFCLSLYFSKDINWRLTDLTAKTLRFAEGKNVGEPIGGRDEIGRLDAVFHGMVAGLETAARRERAIIENAMDVICSIDANGNFINVSPASLTVWGYIPCELVSRCYKDILAVEDVTRTERQFMAVIAGKSVVDFENQVRHRNGSLVTMTWSACWSGSESMMFCVAHDITERKRAEAQIWHQAYHDALTELPNRILFRDRLNQAIAKALREGLIVAVLFLDLDRFKMVNDSLGHSAGDELLREIGRRLTNCLRASDTVARMGGDEFTVLLPRLAHSADAAKVAEKIREALSVPWTWGHQEVQVTASIGIALYPGDGQDAEALIRHSDMALHRIKSQDRNSFQFYTPSMNESAVERLALESDLRRALHREELELFYQPQFDVATGKVTGLEALLRWNCPRRGLVNPNTFISVAEESGLILLIDRWVLRRACLQHREWRESGYGSVRISVNVSARQFRHATLLEEVRSCLAISQMDPRQLELEITETTFMSDANNGVAVLKQLHELGVLISIDDFGTGYSSLSYIQLLPFDTLKIDRSFVRDMATDPRAGAIVTTLITLAQNLNRRVIAEGVETQEQLEFLRSRHCDELQGFLLSRPRPVREVTALLDEQRRHEAQISKATRGGSIQLV